MKTSWGWIIRIAVGLLCGVFSASGIALAEEKKPFGEEEQVRFFLTKSVDYYHAGDFEKSLLAAQNALDLVDRNAALAYNNICSAQMRLGAYELAETACNKALMLDPGFERAWNNLAWVYERVSEETPTAGAFLDLSLARYWQGELDQSVSAAQRALELDPNNAIAHNNICAAFAKGGKLDQAIQECEIALMIDPDYERAKHNLEWAHTRESE
jgi:tetratricopeptide (TPR) repeat protein